MIIDRYNIAQHQQVMTTKMQLPYQEINRLATEVLRIKDQQDKQTNVKADMSSWHLWNEIDLNLFFDHLNPLLNMVAWNSTPVGLKGKAMSNVITDIWSAVYRKGDWTDTHHHFPSAGSFVYYVAANPSVSAPLCFDECINIPVDTDLLVVFPSIMRHHVPVLEEDDTRIVIAGNFTKSPANSDWPDAIKLHSI